MCALDPVLYSHLLVSIHFPSCVYYNFFHLTDYFCFAIKTCLNFFYPKNTVISFFPQLCFLGITQSHSLPFLSNYLTEFTFYCLTLCPLSLSNIFLYAPLYQNCKDFFAKLDTWLLTALKVKNSFDQIFTCCLNRQQAVEPVEKA